MAYDKLKHFTLEKQLAEELRKSNAAERKILYKKLYNRLFSTYPEIAHNLRYADINDRINWQLKLLKPYFNNTKVFMEIGAGDCLLSKELAKHFKQIVAYEVAEAIPFIENQPSNFELKIFNGVDMTEPSAAYDIIYSNQVMEHLHPDDVPKLLSDYHTFLKNDGKLIFVTPHILTGPHDISRDFSDKAEGFHLKEYTYRDVKALLKNHGFKNLKGYIGHRKTGYIGLNISLLILLEKCCFALPLFIRRKFKHNAVMHNLFGLKITADKRV